MISRAMLIVEEVDLVKEGSNFLPVAVGGKANHPLLPHPQQKFF